MAENKINSKSEAERLQEVSKEREKLYDLAAELNQKRRPGEPRLVLMGKGLGDGVHFI